MAKKFILLVEDNSFDELLTWRAFIKNNIGDRLVVVRDGVEALNFLFGPPAGPRRSPAELPALVLLDFQLPRLNGLEVLERLRADERTRQLPVIMLTCSDEERDVERSQSLGLIDYLRKPVDFNEFVRLIGELNLSWLQLDDKVGANKDMFA